MVILENVIGVIPFVAARYSRFYVYHLVFTDKGIAYVSADATVRNLLEQSIGKEETDSLYNTRDGQIGTTLVGPLTAQARSRAEANMAQGLPNSAGYGIWKNLIKIIDSKEPEYDAGESIEVNNATMQYDKIRKVKIGKEILSSKYYVSFYESAMPMTYNVFELYSQAKAVKAAEVIRKTPLAERLETAKGIE